MTGPTEGVHGAAAPRGADGAAGAPAGRAGWRDLAAALLFAAAVALTATGRGTCATTTTERPGTATTTVTRCEAPSPLSGAPLLCLVGAGVLYVPRRLLPEVFAAVRSLPQGAAVGVGRDGLTAARQSPPNPGDVATAETDRAAAQLAGGPATDEQDPTAPGGPA